MELKWIRQQENEEELEQNQPNKLVDDSKRWGAYVAEKVIEYSQTDEEAEDNSKNRIQKLS